ncbi:unnamed protein product [Dimorphilus gyrociliatus]|uniref:Uncharacterized protein n=1 Tax=Dimorphilus gyrociliatus TaxID=2664684 RepID=A0A7I8VVE8_9ANNE|nr:unnamed protein product [Dimorphilus gyrociliatus]
MLNLSATRQKLIDMFSSKREDKALLNYLGAILTAPDETSFPAFGGALEWIRSHTDYLKMFLTLLRIYPNLIHDESLDSFWEFMLPFLRINDSKKHSRYDSFEEEALFPHLPSIHIESSTDDCLKLVYLCRPEIEELSSPDILRLEVTEKYLSNVTFVRTNRSLFTSTVCDVTSTNDVIQHCHTFILDINRSTLHDEECINLLCEAVQNEIPILFIRDPNFQLTIPDNLKKRKLIKKRRKIIDDDIRVTPTSPKSLSSPPSSLDVPYYQAISEESVCLEEVINTAISQSVIYASHLHNACIARLYNKLEKLLLYPLPTFHQVNDVNSLTNSAYNIDTFLNCLKGINQQIHRKKADKRILTKSTSFEIMSTGRKVKASKLPRFIPRCNSVGNRLKRDYSIDLPPLTTQKSESLPPIRNVSNKQKSYSSDHLSQISRKENHLTDTKLRTQSIDRDERTSYLVFPPRDHNTTGPPQPPKIVKYPLTESAESSPPSVSPLTFDDFNLDIELADLASLSSSPDLESNVTELEEIGSESDKK